MRIDPIPVAGRPVVRPVRWQAARAGSAGPLGCTQQSDMIRGTCMFAEGWPASLLYLRCRTIRLPFTKSTGLVAISIILIVDGQAFGATSPELLVVLAAFSILGLASTKSVTATIQSAQPFHFLGVISYSVCLHHWAAMLLIRRIMPSDAGYVEARVTVTLIVAVLSYFSVERPLRILLRQPMMAGPAAILEQRSVACAT